MKAQDTSAQSNITGTQTNSATPPVSHAKAKTPAAASEVSDTEETQVETQLRPFNLILPQDHLFGDWAGLLPKMQDAGITPNLSYTSNIAGNPVGGKSQGLAYCDNIGLSLQFDLKKIVGLDGGSFLISMSQRDGTSLTQKRVGNVFTIQQVYGGQTFHLIDVAYQQKLFDDKLEFCVGRIAAGDDFLVSAYDYLFMQNGFCGNPVGIFFNAPGMSAYPNAAWGIRVKVLPTARTYIMGGVYNGDATIRTDDNHGAGMSMNGPVFAMGEAGYINNGLSGDSPYIGHYKIGGWYDGNSYTDYNTLGYATPSSASRGNWGLYGLFDQVVMPFGEPGSNRGWGVFGSVLASPDQSVSQMPYFFTAGTAARGIWSSRPRDVAGFGVVFGQFSNDLQNAQQRQQILNPAMSVQSHESVLEWTYRFNMKQGAIFVQPDLQYIIRPGAAGQIGNALVLGCQVGINF